jgi:3-oxoacyl-[acyl-carrier protein] reductase
LATFKQKLREFIMAEKQTLVTLILGATGSVGRELLPRLLERGHQVVLGGRNVEQLSALSEEFNCRSIHLDSDQPGSIEEAIGEVAKDNQSLDNVVNCIGSILLKPAHMTKPSEFEDVLRTNLYSSFEVVRGVASAMRKTGGSVVFLSSAAAKIGIPNHEAIAAAKAGVEGLARSAAATYVKTGLRFNVVAPGLVRSEMSRSLWENETSLAASRAMHPLGRIGEPQDIASLITWLVEPENNWMTGQVIGVDGGLSTILTRQKI